MEIFVEICGETVCELFGVESLVRVGPSFVLWYQ